MCFAQIQRPVRGLGRTFGLRSLRRRPSLPWWRGLVARPKQGMLARAAVSRARRPALAVAAYPAPWTCQTAERMLPLCGGGVHALQGRCRAARAGPINGPPSQRGLQVGQDHPGRPNPCRGHPPPEPPLRTPPLRTPPPAASRPADSTCWTRIGKHRSSKSARPASTPSLPTAKSRCGLASSRLAAPPRAGHPGRRSRTTLTANTDRYPEQPVSFSERSGGGAAEQTT